MRRQRDPATERFGRTPASSVSSRTFVLACTEHRSIVVKFLRASIKGWVWTIARPAQAGQISYNHSPSGTTTLAHQKYMATQVAKLIEYGPGKSHAVGYMDPTAYKRTWQILLSENQIKKSPGMAYDQSYYLAASR